jgi:hypothetical protein
MSNYSRQLHFTCGMPVIALRHLPLAALMFWGAFSYATQTSASGLISPVQQNRLFAQIEKRPMVFFVAKGPSGSCGSGCDEWISAEGNFGPGTAQQFREFLAKVSEKKRPIYFHSSGGRLSEAMQIGFILREHRMTAGIGHTETVDCQVFSKADVPCQRSIESGVGVKSLLSARNGQCYSACVYAFAGAATRRVAPGAILGVHSAKLLDLSEQQAEKPARKNITVSDVHLNIQQYLNLMGVNAEIEEISMKVDARRMYVLSRDEIARFGIETRDVFETRWLSYRRGQTFGIMKSVTYPAANDEGYNTAAIRLQCINADRFRLAYFRFLPSDLKLRPMPSITLAGTNLSLVSGFEERDGLVVFATYSSFLLLEQAMTQSTIDIVDEYSPAAKRESNTVRFSTGGLSDAVSSLRKRCAY